MSRPTSASRPGRLLWWLVFVLCLAPLTRLVVLGFADRLGANPVEFVTRSLGTWTLVLLLATLSVTPLRRLTGWPVLARLRRLLGLASFAYACLHLLTYVWFDQWFDVPAIAADIVKRPFITLGFAAFVALVPLAITSTDAMQRRLGRRWAMLHRLAYLAGGLAVLHFVWHKAGKNLWGEPALYALALALLLGFRVGSKLRARRGAAARA